MPSVALQSRENDAVGGDADGGEQSGRGDVDGGAVVVLEEAELDGTSMMYAAESHWPVTKRPCVAHRALISTQFGAGGISGLCARRGAGPDRRASSVSHERQHNGFGHLKPNRQLHARPIQLGFLQYNDGAAINTTAA